MGMDEMECDGIVRRAACPMGGDRLFASRPADHLEPLLPFFGTLWLMVGMEQETTTKRAAAVLRPEQAQTDAVQRRFPAVLPLGPVLGQGRIVGRRRSWHHLVPDDLGPGKLEQVGAAVTVAEDPPVSSGLVEHRSEEHTSEL